LGSGCRSTTGLTRTGTVTRILITIRTTADFTGTITHTGTGEVITGEVITGEVITGEVITGTVTIAVNPGKVKADLF
jgi:hypothetical protein